ncbi:MAG: hypothetical protein AB7D29_07935 [Campylobacterales bacterium]
MKISLTLYARVFVGSILSAVLIIIFLLEINNRTFLCFENGKCVTIWESGKLLMVIDGKYYGLFAPKEYIEVLDAGTGGYGASVYLSKNPKYDFVVFSNRVKNFFFNKAIVVVAENDFSESYKKILNDNIMPNERYDIMVGTELVGGGTIIERQKNTQRETVIPPYRIFKNLYHPLVIIFTVVLLLVIIAERQRLDDKTLKEKLLLLSRIIGEFIITTILVVTSFVLIPFVIVLVNSIFHAN